MAFTPRLPTFHIPVIPWSFDPDTEEWTEGEEFLGQFYYARRDQAGTLLDSKFLVYPLESDVLIDPSEWNFDPHVDGPPYLCDAVQITQPTEDGDATFYWVLSVEPRWLGFPNEHRVAYLKRCTAAEAEDIVTPPIEPPSFLRIEGMVMEDVTCMSCGDLNGDHDLALTVPGPSGFVWELPIGFACFPPETSLNMVCTYSTITGVIRLTFNDGTLGPVAAYEITEVDWDMVSAVTVIADGSPNPACFWPSTLDLTPIP